MDLRPRIRRVRRLLAEVAFTLYALEVLIVVELLIRWVRLPRLARLLGVRLDLTPEATRREQLGVADLTPRARRKVRCALRVTNAWPLGRGPCLRQSLVTAQMLRQQGAAVRLGVAGSGEEILAHAWVEIDGRPLEDIAAFGVFESQPAEAIR